MSPEVIRSEISSDLGNTRVKAPGQKCAARNSLISFQSETQLRACAIELALEADMTAAQPAIDIDAAEIGIDSRPPIPAMDAGI